MNHCMNHSFHCINPLFQITKHNSYDVKIDSNYLIIYKGDYDFIYTTCSISIMKHFILSTEFNVKRSCIASVSYTHLDVYKRQILDSGPYFY